ncbi:MAG: DUF1461 domain-containing protein [Rhodobacteraceae bacterium]|nr:DUF1461 domain-containing protein [Paracoccaceae bacterium]
MKRILITSLLSISLFVICLFLAWKSLSATNFFFERLYQLHAIDEQIKNYAPQNRNKENFELTPRLEHQRIFGEIVSSINSNGKGLGEISYFDPSGEKIDEFLTNNEITHLQDVSELIVSSTQLVLILTGVLIAVYGFFVYYKVSRSRYLWKPVTTLFSFVTMVFTLSLITGIIFVIGTRKVFHLLHEVFFLTKGSGSFTTKTLS